MELVKAFLEFVFLFGLVLVLAWLTTRLVGNQMLAPGRNRPIRLLQHLPAGRDRSVLLMELGGKLYLLGATPQQVSLLDAIDDPDTIRRILEEVPAAAGQPLGGLLPSSFAGVLEKVTRGGLSGRGAGRPEAPPEQTQSLETTHLSEQIERLRRLQEKK